MQKKRNNRCVCLKVQPNKLTCENLMWNFLPTKFKNLRKQENENMHFHHPVNSASRCMRCSLSGNYTLQISLLSHLTRWKLCLYFWFCWRISKDDHKQVLRVLSGCTGSLIFMYLYCLYCTSQVFSTREEKVPEWLLLWLLWLIR